jgi:hypothetical protein
MSTDTTISISPASIAGCTQGLRDLVSAQERQIAELQRIHDGLIAMTGQEFKDLLAAVPRLSVEPDTLNNCLARLDEQKWERDRLMRNIRDVMGFALGDDE